jgi:hypothetical protein
VKPRRKPVEGGFDYFTTTLSISPLKNADKLNEIGEALGKEFGVAWLPSDFKKKDGYLQSIQLSKQYSLYQAKLLRMRVFKKKYMCYNSGKITKRGTRWHSCGADALKKARTPW